jgi:Protein of unknown function (DUF3800)
MLATEQAAQRIRALVSGFPGEAGRQRELLMLQAYVDGSGTGDPNFLVIAGYVAEAETWAEFSKEWKVKLDEAGIPFFKMVQMATKLEIAGWFYRTLEQFDIKASIACVINTKELIEVEKTIKYPSYLTNPEASPNPYFWGFKYIIGTLAYHQERLNLLEPVNFIFDDESEKEKIPRAWSLMKDAMPPSMSRLMGDTPIYRDDKKSMPLQAADLYAWWVLKWQRENAADWGHKMPFPWEKKKKFQSISAYFGRRSFLADISYQLQGVARNEDEFRYAKSLMPEGFGE